MLIVDKEAGAGTPTSKFLKKEEFVREGVMLDHPPRRMNYLFKFKRPMEIPEKEAKLLLEKYPSLYEADNHGKSIKVKEEPEIAETEPQDTPKSEEKEKGDVSGTQEFESYKNMLNN